MIEQSRPAADPMPDEAPADPWRLITDLRRELHQRTTERDEAPARKTATAEVLEVINSLPGDLTPVFDAILEKAHRLCGAAYGSLQTYDGEQFRAVAARGFPRAFADRLKGGFRPEPSHPLSALSNGERLVHLFRFEDGAFLRLASDGVPERFDELLPRDTYLPHVGR